jgi:hypothetical protein
LAREKRTFRDFDAERASGAPVSAPA